MTDHHDELASAHLDGQATAAEAARVSADPDLQARVEVFRTIAHRLGTEPDPVDSVVRRRHLGAAMAAFDQIVTSGELPVGGQSAASDQLGTDEEAVTDPPATAQAEAHGQGPGVAGSPGDGRVVDLASRREASTGDVAQRAGRVAGRTPSTQGSRSRPGRAGLPSWLGAAAAVVLVAGGVIWFGATRQDGSDEATSAGQAAPTTESATDVNRQAGIDSSEDAAFDTEAAESVAAAPAEGGGEGTDTTDAAADASSPTSELGASSTATVPPATTASAPSSVARFAQMPGAEELAAGRASIALLPSEQSICGSELDAPAGTELIGFYRVEVAGEPGEALVYEPPAGGAAAILLVTNECVDY
jgi:hypothetical protein